MGLEIPDEVKWLSWIIGQDWPEGDETAMRRLATAWEDAASGVDEVTGDLQGTAGKVLGDFQGDAATHFEQFWKTFVETDPQYLPKLAEACRGLAKQCDDGANDIEYGKYMFIALLIITAIQIAILIANMIETFGASAAGIPVVEAGAQVVSRSIARQLLIAILKSVAWSELQSVGLDVLIQGIQIWEGNRDGLDLHKTGSAALSGLVNGVIAGGVGFGAGKIPGLSGASSPLQGLVKGAVRDGASGLVSGAAGSVVTTVLQGGDLTPEGLAKAATSGAFGGSIGGAKGGLEEGAHGAAHSDGTSGNSDPSTTSTDNSSSSGSSSSGGSHDGGASSTGGSNDGGGSSSGGSHDGGSSSSNGSHDGGTSSTGGSHDGGSSSSSGSGDGATYSSDSTSGGSHGGGDPQASGSSDGGSAPSGGSHDGESAPAGGSHDGGGTSSGGSYDGGSGAHTTSTGDGSTLASSPSSDGGSAGAGSGSTGGPHTSSYDGGGSQPGGGSQGDATGGGQPQQAPYVNRINDILNPGSGDSAHTAATEPVSTSSSTAAGTGGGVSAGEPAPNRIDSLLNGGGSSGGGTSRPSGQGGDLASAGASGSSANIPAGGTGSEGGPGATSSPPPEQPAATPVGTPVGVGSGSAGGSAAGDGARGPSIAPGGRSTLDPRGYPPSTTGERPTGTGQGADRYAGTGTRTGTGSEGGRGPGGPSDDGHRTGTRPTPTAGPGERPYSPEEGGPGGDRTGTDTPRAPDATASEPHEPTPEQTPTEPRDHTSEQPPAKSPERPPAEPRDETPGQPPSGPHEQRPDPASVQPHEDTAGQAPVRPDDGAAKEPPVEPTRPHGQQHAPAPSEEQARPPAGVRDQAPGQRPVEPHDQPSATTHEETTGQPPAEPHEPAPGQAPVEQREQAPVQPHRESSARPQDDPAALASAEPYEPGSGRAPYTAPSGDRAAAHAGPSEHTPGSEVGVPGHHEEAPGERRSHARQDDGSSNDGSQPNGTDPNAGHTGTPEEQLHAAENEARQLLSRFGADAPTVDYSHMDPVSARAVNESLRTLVEDYPGVVRELNHIGSDDPANAFGGPDGTLAYALLEGNDRGVYLNPDSFGNASDLIADGAHEESTNWTVPGGGGPEGIFNHEFGHQLGEHLLNDPSALHDLNRAVSDVLGLPYDATQPHDPATEAAVQQHLSEYGSTDPHEMMAEAFAEYRGSENPRPLADAIGRVMDDYLRAPEPTPPEGGGIQQHSGSEHQGRSGSEQPGHGGSDEPQVRRRTANPLEDTPQDGDRPLTPQEQRLQEPQRNAYRQNPQHQITFDPPSVPPERVHPVTVEPGEPFVGSRELQPNSRYDVMENRVGPDGQPIRRATVYTGPDGRVTHVDTYSPNLRADHPDYVPNPDAEHPVPGAQYRVDVGGHDQTFQVGDDGLPLSAVHFDPPPHNKTVEIGPGRTHGDIEAPAPHKPFDPPNGKLEPYTKYEVTDQAGNRRGTYYTDGEGNIRGIETESGRGSRVNPELKNIKPDVHYRESQTFDPEAPPPANSKFTPPPDPKRIVVRSEEGVKRGVPFSERTDLEPNARYEVHEYDKGGNGQARGIFYTDETGRVRIVDTYRPFNPDLNNPRPNTQYSVDHGKWFFETGPENHPGEQVSANKATDTCATSGRDLDLRGNEGYRGRDDTAQRQSGILGGREKVQLDDGTSKMLNRNDGGHGEGSQFGGPGELVNMISQLRAQNQGAAHPELGLVRPDTWHQMEAQLATKIGQSVQIHDFSVFALRDSGEQVPHTIQVRWTETVHGKTTVHMRSFPNVVPGST